MDSLGQPKVRVQFKLTDGRPSRAKKIEARQTGPRREKYFNLVALATTAATAATAATATAAAGRTIFTRTRDVDRQGATINFFAVQAVNRLLGFFG